PETPPAPGATTGSAPVTLSQLVSSSKEELSPLPFALQNKKLLRVNLQACGGQVLAKAGSMVAYQGRMSFTRLGSGGVDKWLKKKISGEQFTLMQAQGEGNLFLADAANDIILLQLQNESITVEALNLLAFTPGISWDIELIRGAAGMLTGGLWTVALSGTGYLALICKGEPLTLQVTPERPVFTDPNATVAWSQGLNPRVHVDANLTSLKGIFGSTHGEIFQLAFEGQGFVVIQPSEEAPKTSLQDPRSGGSGGAGGILGGILGH
ncbi:MAG: AIM24 family protein, partial [Candidatus Geothermincolales bacterium]